MPPLLSLPPLLFLLLPSLPVILPSSFVLSINSPSYLTCSRSPIPFPHSFFLFCPLFSSLCPSAPPFSLPSVLSHLSSLSLLSFCHCFAILPSVPSSYSLSSFLFPSPYLPAFPLSCTLLSFSFSWGLPYFCLKASLPIL